MVRILCNLPLDCFDDRARFAAAGIEFLTFGPEHRMARAAEFGADFPFDIEFDAGHQSWHELQARLPREFSPDFVLIYWPEQEPLPRDLEHCPAPVVGVMSDYNIALHLTTGLWPFFDVLLCDVGGIEIYQNLGFDDVRHYVQFSHKTPIHRRYDDVERDLDIAFAGNLNPLVQGERAPYLDRIRRLDSTGVRSKITKHLQGEDYGRLLNRAKIGFNRSVRGEMNLRGFEVPACGGVLLMESSNREVREFFEPDEECILYADDSLEETIAGLLRDESRRARIARAGFERAKHHRMPERILAMVDVLQGIEIKRGDGRASLTDRTFGRARGLMQTWVDPRRIATELHSAHVLAPEDPRPLNDLAASLFGVDVRSNIERAVGLWHAAMQASPDYVIAPINCLRVLLSVGSNSQRQIDSLLDEIGARVARAKTMRDFDGVLVPLGCTAPNLEYCTALQAAAATGDVGALRDHFSLTIDAVAT